MNDKKATTTKQKPEQTFRCGEVTAHVHLRQSNCGYQYYDFVLGRIYKSVATGKECHGATFFDKNEDDLIEAVRKAAAWIRDRVTPDRTGNPVPTKDDAAA